MNVCMYVYVHGWAQNQVQNLTTILYGIWEWHMGNPTNQESTKCGLDKDCGLLFSVKVFIILFFWVDNLEILGHILS